jgi:hypothetical protein
LIRGSGREGFAGIAFLNGGSMMDLTEMQLFPENGTFSSILTQRLDRTLTSPVCTINPSRMRSLYCISLLLLAGIALGQDTTRIVVLVGSRRMHHRREVTQKRRARRSSPKAAQDSVDLP